MLQQHIVLKAVTDPRITKQTYIAAVEWLAATYHQKTRDIAEHIRYTTNFRAYPEIPAWRELEHHINNTIPQTRLTIQIAAIQPAENDHYLPSDPTLLEKLSEMFRNLKQKIRPLHNLAKS